MMIEWQALLKTLITATLSRNTIMAIFLTTLTMIIGYFILSAYSITILEKINMVPAWVYGVCLFCFYFLMVDKIDSKNKIRAKTKKDEVEKERKLEEIKKRLHGLSSEEKTILRSYIDNDTKTQHFSIFDGVHSGLLAAKILYQSSMVSYPGRETFDYNITNWAWDYLKKHPELLK